VITVSCAGARVEHRDPNARSGGGKERSRPGRQARPEGEALTALVVQLSPATMGVEPRQGLVVASLWLDTAGHTSAQQN
jgi:hypothetical protein